MATSQEYVIFVLEQLRGAGFLRYRKMFGEYMVYVNEKPLILVCDNTAFVKKLDAVTAVMAGAAMGYPYAGAKEHYILDIDDAEKSREIVALLDRATPPPPPKKSRAKKA